jgi:hypothetical protein
MRNGIFLYIKTTLFPSRKKEESQDLTLFKFTAFLFPSQPCACVRVYTAYSTRKFLTFSRISDINRLGWYIFVITW